MHVCECACAAHPVLTAVGELHSLTDWQVSEASEEAELVDFWGREKWERRKWREVDQRATEKGGEKSWRSVDEFQAGGIFISVGTYAASIEKKKKKEAACKIIYSDRNVASAGLSQSVL